MAVVIVAGAVTLAAVIYRGFDGSRPDDQSPVPTPDVDVSLKKVRYTETSEGRRKWTLVADGVEYWRESETSRLENIELTFYRPESGQDVLLTARQGQFEMDSREVEVWGDVRLRTEDGMTFRSQKAFYSEETGQISAPGEVHLASQGMDVDAVGMRYELESQRLRLLSDVVAEIVPDEVAENKE